MFTKLTALLDEFAAMGVPSYDILVRHHGKEVYRRMYGFSDYEKQTPIDGSERYFIYSCSKPITVTAAMTLWEKKLFNLDDKLSDYMPEFKTMTVRDGDTVRPAKNLGSPGLSEGKQATAGAAPTREMMKYLAKDPLLFEPGTRYNYSLCHDVLAALVEVLSGMRFGDYVKKVIFDPLGMKDSTFCLPVSEYDTLCAQYRYNAETKTFDNCGRKCGYILGTDYESGGAGCVSSVEDYSRFLEGLRTDAILKPETLALMTTNQLGDDVDKSGFGLAARGYGYGLGMRCPVDTTRVTDFGWGGAAAAYLLCDKVNDITVYYAQHVLGSPNQDMRNRIPPIVAEALA